MKRNGKRGHRRSIKFVQRAFRPEVRLLEDRQLPGDTILSERVRKANRTRQILTCGENGVHAARNLAASPPRRKAWMHGRD